MSAKSAHQGSTNPVCANGFWRSSSVLPPLSPLHVSRRIKNAEVFMRAPLEANGWTQESQVRADGADGLTNLVSAAAEEKTRGVLDWFHISMRLRPIEQMSSRIAIAAGGSDSVLNELLREKLPRIRHRMWNGQWHAALDRMGEIYSTTKRSLDSLSTADAERVRRFRQHMIPDLHCHKHIEMRKREVTETKKSQATMPRA